MLSHITESVKASKAIVRRERMTGRNKKVVLCADDFSKKACFPVSLFLCGGWRAAL